MLLEIFVAAAISSRLASAGLAEVTSEETGRGGGAVGYIFVSDISLDIGGGDRAELMFA